jgi:hypothetical protein
MDMATIRDFGMIFAFAFITYQQWRTKQETVKAGFAAQQTAKVTATIHTLVNSSMSEQKKLTMVATRNLAAVTGSAGDIAAAEIAERAYNDQVRQQLQANAADKIAEQK